MCYAGVPAPAEAAKMTINLEIRLKSYIAHPMTRERSELISIQKASGFNRARSQAKRKQALAAELEKRGMSEADYTSLTEKANAQFFTLDGTVYIPSRNFQSFLAHVAHVAPKAVAAADYQIIRTAVQVQEPGLVTDRTVADAKVFGRYVKLEASNERSWQENSYIEDATATGTLDLDETMLSPKDLRQMIEWGAKYLGIGAARSQGFGRFAITKFET
jgi:hypothetical protein